MTIINCPKCGKEISDATKTCVHCGYKFPTIKNKEITKNLFSIRNIIICSMVIIAILCFCLKSEKNPFEGLDGYPSSAEVQAVLGKFDEQYEKYPYIIEVYKNHSFCGYSGQIEACYGNADDDKEIMHIAVWKHYFDEDTSYENVEKRVNKISKYMDKKYEIYNEHSFSAEKAWKDGHGSIYELTVEYDHIRLEFQYNP